MQDRAGHLVFRGTGKRARINKFRKREILVSKQGYVKTINKRVISKKEYFGSQKIKEDLTDC